jgi:hypothetical protein
LVTKEDVRVVFSYVPFKKILALEDDHSITGKEGLYDGRNINLENRKED